jgi:hypothetical protein
MIKSLLGYLRKAVSSVFGRRAAEPPRGEALLTLRLLQDNRVQTDLSLGGEQLRLIRETLLSVRQKHRGEVQALRAQGQEAFAREMPNVQALVAAEFSASLARTKVLNPDQQQRLQQIVLQNCGPAVFGDPAVQSALGITPEQRAGILSLVEAGRKQARERVQDGEGGAPSARQEIMARALASLTDDQRRRWHELIGRPLEIGRTSPVPADTGDA